MAKSDRHGKSIADRNREIRQEEHRKKIIESNQLWYVIDNIGKMQQLADRECDFATNELQNWSNGNDGESLSVTSRINHLRIVNEQRLRLINKFLPDMKNIEVEAHGSLEVLEIDRTGIYDDDDGDGMTEEKSDES